MFRIRKRLNVMFVYKGVLKQANLNVFLLNNSFKGNPDLLRTYLALSSLITKKF